MTARKNLLNLVIDTFMAIRSHEWTTLFPSMDPKSNSGKYTGSNVYFVKLYDLELQMDVKKAVIKYMRV